MQGAVGFLWGYEKKKQKTKKHNNHLVWVVSQRWKSALLCPPDHSCAVVAILALNHGEAKIAGATQVRSAILYVEQIRKNDG